MYIRLGEDNSVVEIISDYDNSFPEVPIEERYEESFIRTLLYIPNDVEVDVNYIYDPENETFTAPEIPPKIEEEYVPRKSLEAVQIQALADRNEFLEDCIAEMAAIIYA